jgi:dTDP-4-dehydrorhamnose reductase/phosphoglycolate phosphatase-like HAD superfamily hydrolase
MEVNGSAKNVLVLGASGILGRELCSYLETQNVPYIGTYMSHPVNGFVYCDITDSKCIVDIMKQYDIHVCVNCVAQRFIEVCESDWTSIKKVNTDAVTSLAEACSTLKVHLIHISTDYVFDGTCPPYSPEKLHNPLQNYGISKALAEARIHSIASKCDLSYTIIRVPVLYSSTYRTLQETAVTMIGKKVMDMTKSHTEDAYNIRRPVFIPDLCCFIYARIVQEEGKNSKNAIVHFMNPLDAYTKHEIACYIGKYLQKSVEHIHPLIQHCSDRPYDTHLIDTSYDRSLYPSTTVLQGIERCFHKFYHPPLHQIVSKQISVRDIFIFLDLDGTIVNTDALHMNAYVKAVKDIAGIEISHTELSNIALASTKSIDSFLRDIVPDSVTRTKIKQNKNSILHMFSDIHLMPGMEHLINLIYDYDINHVVVTNTSQENIEHFKSHVPMLHKIKNWVYREDYSHPKPDPEPYTMAKERYWKHEPYCIGLTSFT